MGLTKKLLLLNQQKKLMSMIVAEEVFEDVPLGDEEETTPLETEELAPVSQADQGQAENSSRF